MKIGIDIGGVISRYPSQMMMLIDTFNATDNQVYILTDMAYDDAVRALRENEFDEDIDFTRVVSCDWPKHGDLCKTIKAQELGLDILIDDRPDYLASGDFIGLCLSPRPEVPYFHPNWVNKSTPTVCVPPEEYEAFKRWREQNS